MKILNENEVIFDKQIAVFIESKEQDLPANDCFKCCFYGMEFNNYCEDMPCSTQLRKDGKNGWFEIRHKISSGNDLPF